MIAYCDSCGNDADDCVCQMAGDFPNDPILELDTDYLDWGIYEEDSDEVGREEDSSEADLD